MTGFAALAGTAAAEPMSAAEFEAYSTGKTLFYAQNGQVYGGEIYRENRRVTWSFLDGECKDGYWYDVGPMICFIYEDQQDNPQCWTFEKHAGGLVAIFMNEPSSIDLYEAQDVESELVCHGPKVGV